MLWSLIFLGGAVLGLAGAMVLLALMLRRASRSRQELSRRLHETGLGLDRRCDALGEQILTLDRRQRIDHLFELIAHGEAESTLDGNTAQRLRRFALDLRTESFTSS